MTDLSRVVKWSLAAKSELTSHFSLARLRPVTISVLFNIWMEHLIPPNLKLPFIYQHAIFRKNPLLKIKGTCLPGL